MSKKRYSNKELSEDLDATRKLWSAQGFSKIESIEDLVPYNYTVKYIISDKKNEGSLARTGGLLIYNKKDCFIKIRSNRFTFAVSYKNIEELWARRTHHIEGVGLKSAIEMTSEISALPVINEEKPVVGTLDSYKEPSKNFLPVLPKKKGYFDRFFDV